MTTVRYYQTKLTIDQFRKPCSSTCQFSTHYILNTWNLFTKGL